MMFVSQGANNGDTAHQTIWCTTIEITSEVHRVLNEDRKLEAQFLTVRPIFFFKFKKED